ncbi:hypothetical protein SAMN05446589_9242 [Streptomyces sp. OV198]|nr:hypothetical protein SAMN05446589_9242 [Streptomyces sp. OV198]
MSTGCGVSDASGPHGTVQRAVCPGLGLIKDEIGAGTVSGVRCVRLGAQTDRDGVLLAEVPYEGVAKARPFSSVMTAALARPAALGTQPLMAAAFTQPGRQSC